MIFRLGERKLPPRVYCDICEVFDQHETEDCPQQCSEELPAAHVNEKEKKEKKKPPERPYCDTCEGKVKSCSILKWFVSKSLFQLLVMLQKTAMKIKHFKVNQLLNKSSNNRNNINTMCFLVFIFKINMYIYVPSVFR